MERTERIAVVPAGAFGTAMGILAARNGHDVVLYIPRKETFDKVISTGEHPKLPGIELPPTLMVTRDLDRALEGRSRVVFAAPSHVAKRFGDMVAQASNDTERYVLSLTKGLHVTSSGDVMVYTDMLRTLDSQFITSAESGPNFADVVATGEEEVRTVIASAQDLGYGYDTIFSTDMFRIKLDPDERGIQLAGALKNVYAIGVGMCEGARVAPDLLNKLVERGPSEMATLGLAVGEKFKAIGEEVKKETFDGVAGIDDLRLTCSMGSRNYRAGVSLGSRKKTSQELLYEAINKEVVEGVHTANAVRLLSEQHSVELPVMDAVVAVLYDNMSIDEAVCRIKATV